MKARQLHERGIGYYYTGNYEKATQDLTDAIELEPRFAEAYFNRGNVYFATGQFEKASLDFNRALAINPMLWEDDMVRY
jgi:tetratricopeptide (TPR) repeat protein